VHIDERITRHPAVHLRHDDTTLQRFSLKEGTRPNIEPHAISSQYDPEITGNHPDKDYNCYILSRRCEDMEKFQKIALVLGIIIIIFLFIAVDPFIAGVGLFILLALLLSFGMYNTSKRFPRVPELIALLSEDAKSVIIKNKGESKAVSIKVAIVPLEMEFEVPPLAPDEAYTIAMPNMIEEAKAAISYEDESGKQFSHSSPLSALGGGEEDLLKPMFPMFGWK
jgi:hypothetical protein